MNNNCLCYGCESVPKKQAICSRRNSDLYCDSNPVDTNGLILVLQKVASEDS